MRLADLEPKFARWEEVFEGVPDVKPAGGAFFGEPYKHTTVKCVDTLAEAQGISFLCPACFVKNGGRAGTHLLHVGFHDRGLLSYQSSQNKEGKPSRWSVEGTGIEDLTLKPSIDCGCWHGFVTAGECTSC